MTVRPFGRHGGADIIEATLTGPSGMEARILTWGAVLRDLVVPAWDRPRPVVLGYERLDDYVERSGYFGAIVGRYANRIGGASFRLGGREIRLLANEGSNTLHGGPVGFSRRNWTILDQAPSRLTLRLVSEDGDQGFPGRLTATATYSLMEPATLRLELEAFCEAPTVVNLSTHSYFNLDGSPDIRDHRLQILADADTPVDADLIPTGEILSVAGSRYDLRRPTPLRAVVADRPLDLNFVLSRNGEPDGIRLAALLLSPAGDLALRLSTTEPGLQVYDGNRIQPGTPGLRGATYGPHAGLALEPQRFPDSPNRPYFPRSVLRPGETSRQITDYAFIDPAL